MRIFLCFLILPLLACCALPSSMLLTHKSSDEGALEGRLLHIRIERWNTLRFAGLLGVRETAGGLDYVLLDATGVKLLEAQVAADGSFTLLQESGPLRKSGLPPFLAEALARIYLQAPDRSPCAGSWWYRLCRETGEDGSSVKTGQAGPFTLWRITGGEKADSADGGSSPLVYHQPWLGVKVKLEGMEARR